ncbi:MAG: Crp/Fnr family transcriptional regulator [Sulfuricaulis sp.]|nr:Crp/Fnr family transcriptional regulator [Sulfuricaulis sp.]
MSSAQLGVSVRQRTYNRGFLLYASRNTVVRSCCLSCCLETHRVTLPRSKENPMLFQNPSPVANGLPAALPRKKHPRPRVANRPSAANLVLAALPPKDYQRLLTGLLEPVKLIYGQILYEPGERIRHVYFPTDCLVSLLTAIDKHQTLEVGMVGNEGMVGMPLVLGIGASAVRALVQGSGTAMRMTAARFRAEFKKNIPLQQALFRYTHLLMAQVSQTAACNRFHRAEARLARWLLMTGDRLHSNEFRLTHEFLSHMLGLRRVGVTRAASDLERKKIIDYSRGKIRILDRKGLEAAACTCYRIVKNLQDGMQA